ncbi:MAG: HAMP domain-containing protein, partial [Chloroflexi bacterium]|nr:HAMP domain-containing protein [Chloroflexota bacterium]
MARSLAARIAVAFAALSLAVLVGTGGALFVALRSLHTEAQDARLTDLADGLAGTTRQMLAEGARAREVLEALRSAVPEGVAVTFRTTEGRLVRLDDTGPVGPIGVEDGSAAGAISHGSAVDAAGRPLRYALISVRAATTPTSRAVIVSAPDMAADMAARDVARTLPIVLLVLLIVGVPVGWLLWRSVARPLGALSDATARVPAGSAPPLPLGGPTEVRELTAHFNAMTVELERRRREEADLLQNLRHDLRTPLTVIGGFAQ